MLILFFLYIAKVTYDYMVWFLIRSLWCGVAFCPSVLELSSLVSICVPSDGCPHYWGRFWWPWGIFIFYSVLLLVKSILLTSRHDFDSLFWWVLSLMRSISVTLRHKFIFYSALPSVESIFLTLRHEVVSCSALPSMGSISLTLRHKFIFCSALTSVGSISLTLRHQFNFCSGSLSDI